MIKWLAQRLVCVISGLGLLSACTFHSSQWDTLRSLYVSDPKLSGDFIWQARLGNQVRGVMAINQDNLIVFASEWGDAITFDGWTIRSVTGFDLDRTLQIKAVDIGYQYGRAGRVVEHICSGWLPVTLPHEGWLQKCESEFSYQNVITLDKQGRIIKISQVLEPDGTRLTLTKVK